MFDVFRADNPQLLGLTRSTNLPQLIHSTVALYRQQAEAKGISLNVLIELSAQRYDTDPLLIIRILSASCVMPSNTLTAQLMSRCTREAVTHALKVSGW
jgi:hypothetical protein